MNGAVALNLWQFSLVYVLLLVVLAIMKKCRINQTRLLLVASFRMSVQLVLAGLILTAIFQNPHPMFVVLYLFAMTAFATYMVLSKNPGLNKMFKLIVTLSLGVCGLAVVAFFVMVVVGESLFNPQYAIPISGMVIGNAMTGVSLGIKAFYDSLTTQRNKVETLINMGVTPTKILNPFVNQALETAMLPTMNTMLGMGIISLPGMMTGQILSGTLPTTAILYQIAIIIAICAVTSISVFSTLYFGSKTLFHGKDQSLALFFTSHASSNRGTK